jgi:sphingolipid delta-4 desaturase
MRFEIEEVSEPHAVRRRLILEKYPEITKLYGSDIRSAYFCSVTILIQFVMMYIVRDWSLLSLVIITYTVSGTLNHSLFLAMHEVTHDLFFNSRLANRIFSHIVNLPMGVPASAYFKVYHNSHHTDLGEIGQDTDIPSSFEGFIFRGKFGRAVWLCLQSLAYIIRPILIKPLPVTGYIVMGSAIQYSFDIWILYYFGWKSLFYLLVGSILGGALHPISGHFIAEHFEFVPGQATYSYYGPLNWITYNVGYHVEHHDFPKIPCTRLPLLKKIAPEWYDLPSYDSWVRVLVAFIMNDNMSLYARSTRRNPRLIGHTTSRSG